VLLRDRCRCRVPGCGLRRYVDVHHLQEQSQGGVHSRSNCLCLCERHHRMLHAGQLRIEGDADAAFTAGADPLRFYHADGEAILDPWTGPSTSSLVAAPLAATPAGAQLPPGSEAQTSERILTGTHSGSAPGARSDLPPDAAKLLRIMGQRGGWIADALCEKSDLSASEVAVALTALQLARRVARDAAGRYAPLRC
jgi:hypothetical protein